MARQPELIVEKREGFRYAALVSGGKLLDLAVDWLDRPCLYNSIWVAKIDRLVPGVGAFAHLGKRSGLLREEGRKSGEVAIVQIKSLRSHGKADILTDDISLPGKFFVYLPRTKKITTSKKITPAAAVPIIAALKKADITGGILRAGALSVPQEMVIAEAATLKQSWQALEKQATKTEAMLQAGPTAYDRLLHDYPQYKLKPANDSFDARGLTEQLEALRHAEIKLAKGGSVIIERTSALTAIDVNAGTRPAATVDREALELIATQIRLRNLSGLIVIDFTGETTKDKGAELLEAVRKAVADDPAGCRVVGISPSGLIELTRSGRDLPLAEKLARRPLLGISPQKGRLS